MLILTRRSGETIKIGDDITVMVIGINGNQVRLGIDAPDHVAVHREEVYKKIKEELENIECDNDDILGGLKEGAA